MNIIIFSVTAGQGHHATAAAISQSLTARGHNVQTLDMLKLVSPYLQKTVDKGYNLFIKYSPKSYGKVYESVGRNQSLQQDVVELLTSEVIVENAYNALLRLTPDVILSTHVFASQILDELRKRQYTVTPHIGIITDFTVHPTWEQLKRIDYIVTCGPHLESRAVRLGIPADKLLPFGIPVLEKFTRREEPALVRRRLGLREDLHTVLIMSGSMGFGHIQTTVENIAASRQPMQLLVVCGNNKRGEEALRERNFPVPARVMGYVNNVDELMDAADIVVTKPGGLTVSEALAKGKPMILVNPIPGQEQQNADYLTNLGLAMRATNIMPAQELLQILLQEPARLEQMRYAIEHFAPRNAVQTLSDFIEERFGARRLPMTQSVL